MSCFQVIYESFSCSCFAFTLWLLPLFNLYLVVFFISRGSCLFISLRLFEYNAIFTYSYMYEMCFWIYLIYVKSHLLLFCFFFYWAFLKTVSRVYSIESLLYLLFYFCYTYNHFRPPRRSCQCHIVQRWLLSEAGDAWKYFTLRLSDTQPFLRLMRVILFSFKKIYYYFLAGYFKKKKK